MRKFDRSVALAALVVAGSLTSLGSAQTITVDGSRDAGYGNYAAVQTVGTQFGNATNGNPIQANGGSELDNAYSRIADGKLYLFFGGNLESNYNKLDIFIDSIAGGQSQLRGDNSGIDFGGLNRMGGDGTNPGLKLPNNFAADFYITVTNGNSSDDTTSGIQYFSNAAELLDDGRGNGDFVGGSGILDPNTATNAVINGTSGFGNGITIGANNSNVGGVGSLGEADTSDPAAVGTGIEVAIPLSLIGNPNGSIFVSAFVNGSGHDFVSNQVLGALPADTGNLGEPRTVDLSTASAYFTAGITTDTQIRFDAGSGNYSNAANFRGGVMPAADGSQILTVNRGAPTTITLDTAANLNYLEVQAGPVTVDGASTLTISGTSRRAFRTLAGSGATTITAPVVVTKDAAYEIAQGSSLTISSLDTQGHYIDKVGGGALVIPEVHNNGLDIRGGSVKLTNASAINTVSLLSIASGTSLDLTGSAIVVDYSVDDNNSSPLPALKTAITEGRLASSTVTGPKTAMGYIDSAANPALVSFGDVPLDTTALVFRQTLKGDSDLNRIVNFQDLVRLAQNYNGTSAKEWYNGDSDFDGDVDFADLVSLAQNYNASLPSVEALTSLGGSSFAADWAVAQSLVPEPTSLAALLAVSAIVKRRRA